MQATHRAIRLTGVGILVALAASCSPQTTAVSRDAVASVAISPTSVEVGVGGAVPLQATVKDGGDNVLADRQVNWNSSDTTIASVSDVGVVTARRAGSAQIAASSEGKFAIAVVTVVPPRAPVASVTVLPNKVELLVGQKSRLQAIPYDAARAPLPDRPVTWVTSKPTVATVDADGFVTAVARGSATITATSEGKTGSSNVTVARP